MLGKIGYKCPCGGSFVCDSGPHDEAHCNVCGKKFPRLEPADDELMADDLVTGLRATTWEKESSDESMQEHDSFQELH